MSFLSIEQLQQIKDKRTRIGVVLELIQEYSGLLHQQQNIGLFGITAGNEIKASKKALETKKHIQKLKNLILKEQ